jgi:hypothetical protein
MSWTSARETKKREDIAYCLLGIFGINMPLLYGEGKRAFQRLQEEIMKQSDDQSILVWNSLHIDTSDPWKPFFSHLMSVPVDTLLAKSPAAFGNCGNIVRSIGSRPIKPYAVTNRGLQIEFPLLLREFSLFAGLNCRFEDDFLSDLAIPIHRDDNDQQYQRSKGELLAIPIANWRHAEVKSIYMKLSPMISAPKSEPTHYSFFIRTVPDEYKISQVFPSAAWFPVSRTIKRRTDFGGSQLKRIASLFVHGLLSKKNFLRGLETRGSSNSRLY